MEESQKKEDFTTSVKTFEDLIRKLGGRGLYSVLCLCIMFYELMIPALTTISPTFVAAEVVFNCSDTRLEIQGNEKCEYTVSSDNCHIQMNCSGVLGEKTLCQDFSYDHSVFKKTIITRFNLVCDKEHLANLPSTLYFAGFLVGCTAFGMLSDKIGRQKSNIISLLITSLFTIGAALSPFYWLFVLCQLVVGFATGGVLTILITFAIESTDVKNRPHWGFIVQNGWTMGMFVLTLMAYLNTNYQVILGIISIISLTPIPAILFIGESARWLVTTKRQNKADLTIQKIAKLNNHRDFPKSFTSNSLMCDEERELTQNESLVALFKTPGLRKVTLITWFLFAVIAMGYYGISLAVGSLGGDIFVNQLLSSLVEPPARIIGLLVSLKIGRKTLFQICFLLSGISLLVSAILFQFDDLTNVRVGFAMHGKLWITMAFDIIWLYAGEVFPTALRTIGCGSGSTVGRVGALLSTLLYLLSSVWTSLPFFILGLGPFIGTVLVCFIPETAWKPLPETVEDGEVLANSTSCKTFCCVAERTQIMPVENNLHTVNE